MDKAHNLSHNEHGLTDGSYDGDWRLPTKEEWEEFMSPVYNNPALVNTVGDGQWSQGDAFTDVGAYANQSIYWSSTVYQDDTQKMWWGAMSTGTTDHSYGDDTYHRVWPVRNP